MLIAAIISLVVSTFGALGIQLSHLSRMWSGKKSTPVDMVLGIMMLLGLVLATIALVTFAVRNYSI